MAPWVSGFTEAEKDLLIGAFLSLPAPPAVSSPILPCFTHDSDTGVSIAKQRPAGPRRRLRQRGIRQYPMVDPEEEAQGPISGFC